MAQFDVCLRRSSKMRMAWVLGLIALAAVRLAAQEPDPVATRKYTVALGFQKRGLYDEAAVRWQQFITTYPKSTRLATAHHHLGVCQIQQKKFTEAVKTLRQLLKTFPKFASLDSTQFNLGLALYNSALSTNKAEDFVTAANEFAAVGARYPASSLIDRAYYYQAECLCLAGRLDQAVPIYQTLLTKFPKSPLVPQVHYALAATLQDMKKLPEAVASLNEFIKKYPKDPLIDDSRLRLGLIQFEQKKFADAERVFAVLASSKGFASADYACLKHARSLFEQGKLPQAAGAYESLPTRFPKSDLVGTAFIAAGKCRYELKQWPQAERNCSTVIARKLPESAEASVWLGRSLIQRKQFVEAVKKLDQATAAYPDSPFRPELSFIRIEAVYQIPNRQKEAIAQFTKFATDHPQHAKAAEALYRAALGSLQLADYGPTRKLCESFVATAGFAASPFFPEILAIHAESLLQPPQPDPVKAEAVYRQLVGKFPGHSLTGRAQLGIGAALYAQNKFDAAIDQLTKSVAVFNKDSQQLAESRMLIGRCHLDSKRAPQAVAALKSALAAKADWEHVDEVLFVLAVALQSVGETNAAIAELNKLESKYPKSQYRQEARQQLGNIYHHLKQYAQAIAQYQKIVKESPQSPTVPTALYGLAAAYFDQDQMTPALSNLDLLLKNHSQATIASKALYLRGLTRLKLGQLEPGRMDLTQYLATKPARPEASAAQVALAQCQAGLKQFAPAIATLTSVIKEDADYERIDDVYYQLAFLYLDTKNQKQAVENFRALTVKRPKSPRAGEAFYRIGEFHENAEQIAEAVGAYSSGLQVAVPEDEVRERLYYKIASLQFKKNQFTEADKALTAQLKEFATGSLSAAARFLSAECAYRQNNNKEALLRFTQLMNSNDPRAKEFHARSAYRAGTCAANLKDWPASQNRFETLIARFPKFDQIGEARYGLGLALQNQSKLPEARTVFQQVTDTEANTVAAAKSFFMMGQCWFAEKQYQKAIDCFSEVAFGFKHDQWQPLSYFEAGRCYLQLKKPEAARKMLNVVVQEFSSHPRAKDAQAILRQIDNQ